MLVRAIFTPLPLVREVLLALLPSKLSSSSKGQLTPQQMGSKRCCPSYQSALIHAPSTGRFPRPRLHD